MKRFDIAMKCILLFGMLIIRSSELRSQVEHNLFNLDYAPQSQWVNPAAIPKTNWHFGIGALLNSSWPVSYNDVISKRNGDTVYINGENLLSKMGSNNHFNLGLIPDISFGFKIKKGYLSFGMKENIVMNLSAPKDVFEFLIRGNGQPSTLGQYQNIGGFQINGMHYRELFAGAAYQYNSSWTFGARLKYLIGYENIQTVRSDLSVKTDPLDYTITMKSSYLVNTSGLGSNFSDKYNGGPFASSGNKGFGVDLGANYRLNEKFSFSGSLIDLGFINWSDNNQVYRTKKDSATYSFSGIDLYNLSSNKNTNYLENILDTIRTKFDFEETKTSQSYTSSLYSKLYLGGQYRYNERFQFGALTSFTIVNNSLLPALTLYSKANLYKILQAQLSYQMNQNSLANIGMGFVVNLGPLQYYFMSDNIIGTTFAPLSSKNVSFRTGFNIQWSYKKDKDSFAKVKPVPKLPPLPVAEATKKWLDLDRDSIEDELDYCPEMVGSKSNKGCPPLMDISLIEQNKLLIFRKDKAELNPNSFIALQKMIARLNANPKAKLIMQVRCESKEYSENEQLGLSRTKYLHDLLTSKGIMDRVAIFCKNAKEPISTKENPGDQMLNRSIEVDLIEPK